MTPEAPRVGAYLLTTDGSGRILAVRMRGGPFKGEWLLPGGGVEPGESLEAAVRRETGEETGMAIEALRHVDRYEVRSTAQPGFHFHVHAFTGTVRGTPQPEEGSEVRWLRTDELVPHPVLRRELADAGLVPDDPKHFYDALRAAGVDMTRLGLDENDAAWYEEKGALRSQGPLPLGLEGWELGRKPIAEAVDRDATFLDVGCANGLLMESLTAWAAERGHRLEAYGLDLSEKIVALARARYPKWTDRVFTGNALMWSPPRRFDLVRTELEHVPRYRAPELVRRLLDDVVAPGGRLIVCGYGTNVAERVGDTLRRWGYAVSGETEGRDREGRVLVRVAWIDRRSDSADR